MEIKNNNNNLIQVIYKKANQHPEVKIIKNISTLEKLIIQNKVTIIPYKKSYIICYNKKIYSHLKSNIFNMQDDFIIININKNKKKFTGLSKIDIVYFLDEILKNNFKY